MTADPQDQTVGGNMASHISYYDTAEQAQKEIIPPYGSDRHSLTARYRVVAAAKWAREAFPSFHLRTVISSRATAHRIRVICGTAHGAGG